MRETAFSFLDDQERERVESAVAEAEQMTSAEFVCAVATESGRYDRAESFIGFAFAVLLLSAANLVTWQLSRGGDWGRAPSPPFLVQLLMVSLGFVLGTTLASYWHGLRRLAVSSREMTAETAKAASHVFTDHGVGHLDNRGGVLIYVSLFERTAILLANRCVFEALGADELGRLRDAAIGHLQAGQKAEAYIDVLATAAEILNDKLPAADLEPSRLANSLICIHPRP
jgi:putative membrane protein